jgi:hypothetical protein
MDRAPSFLCYWNICAAPVAADKKTFYSIIKTIVPYLSTAEKLCFAGKQNFCTDFAWK